MTFAQTVGFAIVAAIHTPAVLLLPPACAAAETNSVLRVMTFNIHHAEGLDGTIDTQRIADLILAQRADLVGLNEVDRGTTRTGGRDLIAELSQQTGMSFVFSNNFSFQGGEYGNAILSRFPILSRDHRLLPRLGSNEQRGWLKAVVDVNGKFLSFWVTHLASVVDNTERLMCVTNFNEWLSLETLPVICCDDFNDTPGSGPYGAMATAWKDIWATAGSGSGWTVPVPTPTKRIDYIWTAKGAALVPTTAAVPYTEASDHFPVVTKLVLTNATNHAAGFYLSFDEGAGSNVIDSVSGLAGAFDASVPVWSTDSPIAQPGDSSLSFDGASKVSVRDPAQIIGTNGRNGNYTLQAWVKLPLNYLPSARMILFQYERIPGFSFSINTNRTLHTTTFQVKDIPSTAALPNDGQWHHVAVVHADGLDMKFYIDAGIAATVAYTNGPGHRTSSTITIGSAAGGANAFTGLLDRVSFENRALTPEQFDFPAMPPLGVRRYADALVVFWRTRKTGYTLQVNSSLQSAGWTGVPVAVQGDESLAVIAPTNSARYYRLGPR